MKQKTKVQKGITLIALIITIVVLLILAAVAIASITNDGVLSYAENATTKYNQAVKNEQDILQGYIDYLNKHNGGTGSGSKVEGEGSGTVLAIANKIQESNTKVVDEFGNQIVVPAGFKIRVDADAGIKGDEKSNATNVTQGIVIEDEVGNQFVWVPVGTIYTNVQKTESKTITLGRYQYQYDPYWGNWINDYIPNSNGEYEYTPISEISWRDERWISNMDADLEVTISCTEETITESGLGSEGNAIARNIENFQESAKKNGGYYIGRFEAGKENNTLVCKAEKTVYVDVTQPESSTLCKKMYNDGADGYNANTFSSDLINSYAWDTATIFIQTFGGENEYYKQNKSTSFTITGGNGDEYCNINDMSGNAFEWTTETISCTYERDESAVRGGYFEEDRNSASEWTSNRSDFLNSSSRYSYGSFRPVLYVAKVEEIGPYMEYELGDTVTIGTESFYVIGGNDINSEEVILFAKDKINTSTYKQSVDASSVRFSSTNYWVDEVTSYEYDLIEVGEPSPDHYAAYHAYRYAKSIDESATGRLMTYNEALTLERENTVLRNVIYGAESEYTRSYWLGTADSDEYVWYVMEHCEEFADLASDCFDYSGSCYIRPVVIISKSLLP